MGNSRARQEAKTETVPVDARPAGPKVEPRGIIEEASLGVRFGSKLVSSGSPPPNGGLSDAGLAHPTATRQRAALARTLQRQRGNAFVQRAALGRGDASGDTYEREADGFARMMSGDGGGERLVLSRSGLAIQCAPEEGSAPQSPPPPSPATPGAAKGPGPDALFENEAAKQGFIGQLEKAICQTAEEALAGTIWSATGCPYITRWIAFYRRQSPDHALRAMVKFAPETAKATTANECIAYICGRVRRGINKWVETGEVTGVPKGVSPKGSDDGAGGGEASAAGSDGDVQLKSRDGRAEAMGDPQAIRAQLGTGRQLDSGVRSRMESVFGMGFGHVRVHTDDTAGRLSSDLNARAFTVGQDVAFGRGEYQPGTPVGDALIAHELAHTVQQQGNSSLSTPQAKGEALRGGLEDDADRSAVGAIVSLLTGTRDLAKDLVGNAMPRLRSGLRLQRCEDCGSKEDKKVPWWEEKVIPGTAGQIYVRPPSRLEELRQLLRQVEVVVEPGAANVKKTPPGSKGWHYFQTASVKPTQWTPKEVKEKVAKLFGGKEVFVWKKTAGGYISQVKKIVADYRKKHPNTFSILQGQAMATTPKWPPSDPNCIATMNRGLQALYGSRTLTTGDLGKSVQDSTKALERKKMVAAKKTFAAVYAGSKDRFQILDEDRDLLLGGAGQWILDQIKATTEDGVYVFVVNIANGYHSAAVIARKDGTNVALAWRDQLGSSSYGTGETTAAGIDKSIRRVCRWRYRKWVRDTYNKLYGTDYGSIDDIPRSSKEDDEKLKKAEDTIQSTVVNDVSINTVARLRPI